MRHRTVVYNEKKVLSWERNKAWAEKQKSLLHCITFISIIFLYINMVVITKNSNDIIVSLGSRGYLVQGVKQA